MSAPRLSVRVQHHPSRADLLPPLLESLAPLAAEVSEHASDPPSPLAGYLKALTDPPDCTHLIVLQDDVTVCRDFATVARRVAERQPAQPVALFLARLPAVDARNATRAMQKGDRFIQMRRDRFVPVVGMMWPIEHAAAFRDWVPVNRLPGRQPPRSDDGAVSVWAQRTKTEIAACVPSIVQHLDQAESTIGRKAMWGKDKGRTALYFADDYPDHVNF